MPQSFAIPFELSYVVLWVLVIGQSLLLIGLVRVVYNLQQNTTVAPTAAGRLSAGAEAPRFRTVDLGGQAIDSKQFSGHLTALLFVSPNCHSCTATLYEMEALQFKTKGNLIVVARAGVEDAKRLAQTHKIDAPIVADADDSISRAYGISGVPTAVLINAENRIQSYGTPKRAEEIESMLEPQPQVEVAAAG